MYIKCKQTSNVKKLSIRPESIPKTHFIRTTSAQSVKQLLLYDTTGLATMQSIQ